MGGFDNWERSVIEDALPAHMMALMATDMNRGGWSLRKDMWLYLNRAVAAAFGRVDRAREREMARRVDDLAAALLSDIGPDNSREGFMAVCYFAMKLASEGLWRDVRNSAVLIAMACRQEALEHGEDWRVNERRVALLAGAMILKAQAQGLYRIAGTDLPPSHN